MKQVNFSALEIQGIDGSKQRVDIQDELANLIYMQGLKVSDCELGRKLYNAGRTDGAISKDADRTVNLNTEDVEILKRVANQFPYVIRTEILKAIDVKDDD